MKTFFRILLLLISLNVTAQFDVASGEQVGLITIEGTDHLVYKTTNGSEYIMITVTDESGDVVWQSDSDFEFEEIEDIYQYNDDNYLLVEDYQKGNFFIYTLETDEDFNPDLLSAKVVELLDGRSELITDLKYNGEEMLKDYGDTGSKGFTYMLS